MLGVDKKILIINYQEHGFGTITEINDNYILVNHTFPRNTWKYYRIPQMEVVLENGVRGNLGLSFSWEQATRNHHTTKIKSFFQLYQYENFRIFS